MDKLPIGTEVLLLRQNTKFRFLTKFTYPRISIVCGHNSAGYPIVSLRPDSSIDLLLSYFDYVLMENVDKIKSIKYLL